MDEFIELIIWCLAVFGATNGIVVSKLMEPLRLWITYSQYEYYTASDGSVKFKGIARKNQFFSKLIHCPMCLGFWIGGLFSYLFFSPSEVAIYPNSDYSLIMAIIFDAFLGSATSWLLYLFIFDKQYGK